jgi:hypothetical protein
MEKRWLTSTASMSFWNFLAATPDVVKMEAPFPYLQRYRYENPKKVQVLPK